MKILSALIQKGKLEHYGQSSDNMEIAQKNQYYKETWRDKEIEEDSAHNMDQNTGTMLQDRNK